MKQVPVDVEDARVAAVHAVRILDTGPEQPFDDLARLASASLRVPVVLVNFVDRDRQWFKAKVGVTESEAPRYAGFCPYVVASRRTLVVPDVAGAPEWRKAAAELGGTFQFYAGTPLVSVEGHVLGTVCVADYRPRGLTASDTQLLEAIARLVLVQLETRGSVAALQESEERFRRAFDDAAIGMVLVAATGEILRVNPSFEQWSGYTEQELLGRTFQSITHPDDLAHNLELFNRAIGGELSSYRLEKRYLHKDGRVLWASLATSLIRDKEGRPAYLVSQVQDITERKRAEDLLQQAHRDMERRVEERTAELRAANEELRSEVSERQRIEEALRRSQEQLIQSQKLQAVGQLAGGVAHEFNNILTVILGYVSVLEGDFTPGDPRVEDVRRIGESAHRAAQLTRQLLAFSRHQRQTPQLVDLNTLLHRQEQMLVRVIGENVRISLRLSDQSSPVRVDPAHIEQVVLNLAINARDAMPDGGTFQLETRPYEVEGGSAHEWDGLRSGSYVALIVSDTGHGMTPEVQTRAFEPFFTTKEVGRGTGLGLSTVYGIVAQSGGHIRVVSQPGVGTTFTILLPRVEPSTRPAPDDANTIRLTPRGSETILLVEDETPLRALAASVLRRRGYWVLEASNGLDALALAARESGPVHLLLTDVVMPGMTGAGLASRLLQTRPEARVLYMSGYTDKPETIGLGLGSDFIGKPFTPDELLERVRALLDRPAPSSGSAL